MATAVRHVYGFLLSSSFSISGRISPLGKNMRKSNNLEIFSRDRELWHSGTYIMVKHDHCMPTCAIPRSPAAHSNVLTVLQQATSAREAGRTKIFAKAHVEEVVPRRMKNGDMPSEVARAIIR